MFSLVQGLVQSAQERPIRRVIMLGEEQCGKTTFLEAAKGLFDGGDPLKPEQIRPTVGLNVGKLKVKQVAVLLWDLGGKSSLRSIWDRYLDHAEGIIFVIDATNETQFLQAKVTLRSILARESMKDRPLLVFVNKQDVQNDSNFPQQQQQQQQQPQSSPDQLVKRQSEKISTLFVSSFVRSALGVDDERPLLVLPGEALNRVGVAEGIEWIVDRINAQIENGLITPGNSSEPPSAQRSSSMDD